MKKTLLVFLTLTFLTILPGCGSTDKTNDHIDSSKLTLAEITNKAEETGLIVTTGMPDTWANYGDTWKDLEEKYGIKHLDTDMGSAKSIAKWDAERNNPTADMADVGLTYGDIAIEKGLAFPYKTSYWDKIPDWAKDEDGHWIMAYYGVLALVTNPELVEQPPRSYRDILDGDYPLSIGDIAGNQEQMAIINAALAFGGDLNNLQPGLDFYAQLAKEGRLKVGNNGIAGFETGEAKVSFIWDFNALKWDEQIKGIDLHISIPEEGSIISGYIPLINRYAPRPYSAMLALEHMLSDEGQINFARGYGHPIRQDIEIPKELKDKFLPESEYEKAKPLYDIQALRKAIEEIPTLWEEEVLVHLQ